MVITYRPVQTSDAENLLRWRNQEKVRDLFFNRDVINIEDHLSWLKSVESNPKKSIWIIAFRCGSILDIRGKKLDTNCR